MLALRHIFNLRLTAQKQEHVQQWHSANLSAMSPVYTPTTVPLPPSPLFSRIYLKTSSLRLSASSGLTDNKELTRRKASENPPFSSEIAQILHGPSL
jgi:hypothetical protein